MTTAINKNRILYPAFRASHHNWGQSKKNLKVVEDFSGLSLMHCGKAIGPEDEISQRNFFSDGHLRGDALADLEVVPATGSEAGALRTAGTGGANHFFKMKFGAGFKEERDDDDGNGGFLRAPRFNLRQPAGADARVQDGFKLFAGGWAGKDDFREGGAVQTALRLKNFRTKKIFYFELGGLAGLDEFAGDFIGVNDLRAQC